MRKKRSFQRFLISLPMTYSVLGAPAHADDGARVHDLTPEGFGFESERELKAGWRLAFSIELDPGERVTGQARIVWSRKTERGTWAGAHITRLSWRDRRLIKRLVLPPGYDWEAFFDRLLTASFIVAVVLLVEDLLRHHRAVVETALGLWKEALAAAAMGVSIVWFWRHGGRRRR